MATGEEKMEGLAAARLQKAQLHASYGTKKGLKRRNWKRRYFVLTISSIAYYNLRGERMGEIPLSLVQTVFAAPDNPRELCIQTEERTFRVVLDSDADMHQWLRWLPCTGVGSLLFERIRAGDHEAVARLLECGASPVEQLQDTGYTPLLAAASLTGSLETSHRVMAVLLESEEMDLSHLRCTTVDGRNALHLACEAGNTEGLQLLHAHLSAIDPAAAAKLLSERDARGRCLLHLAAESGSVELAQWLLVHMTPEAVHYRSGNDQSPLHTAASRGHLELCRLLLNSGADLEDRDCRFDCPMDMAVCGSHMELADWLRSQSSAAQVCTPWLHSILISSGCYAATVELLAKQRSEAVPWEALLAQLTAPSATSSVAAAPPPAPLPTRQPVGRMDDGSDGEALPAREEETADSASSARHSKDAKEPDASSPTGCFHRLALIVNVLIGWARHDLVEINARGCAGMEDVERYLLPLHRLAAAQRLVSLCESILPDIECPPSAVDVDVHVRQHEWAREAQSARDYVIGAQARVEAYYMMGRAVLQTIRKYNPSHAVSEFEEAARSEGSAAMASRTISDVHYETLLRSVHSITSANCTLARDAHKRLDQRREEITSALKHCQYLKGQPLELEELHETVTEQMAPRDSMSSAKAAAAEVSYSTFDLGQLWNERLTSTLTVVLSAFAATTLNHMHSAAPCGFAVCLRGAMARKETFPFSQVELVLFVSDTNHMSWFRIFANLFHIKLLQLGETEFCVGGLGSVCPSGLSLAPPAGAIEGLQSSPFLIGTPKRVAELQRQEQYSAWPRLADSLLAVQFFYGSDPDLVGEYEQYLATFLSAQTGDAALLCSLRQLHTAEVLVRELEWGAISFGNQMGLLSPDPRERALVDLTDLWNFGSSCIGALAVLSSLEPAHCVPQVAALLKTNILCPVAASELTSAMHHLSALVVAFELYFSSRVVQFLRPCTDVMTENLTRSLVRSAWTPLETAHSWLGLQATESTATCEVPVVISSILQHCLASLLKLHAALGVELKRNPHLVAADCTVVFPAHFPSQLVARAREWLGFSLEAEELLGSLPLELEVGAAAVLARASLARMNLADFHVVQAVTLSQQALATQEFRVCGLGAQVEALAVHAAALGQAGRWAEGVCSVEKAAEECGDAHPGLAAHLRMLSARFLCEDLLYHKALRQLEEAVALAAASHMPLVEAGAQLFLSQALRCEDGLERSEEAALAAEARAGGHLPWRTLLLFRCLVIRATALAARRDYAEAAALLETAWYRAARWCGTASLHFAGLLLDVAGACNAAGGKDVRLRQLHAAATAAALAQLRGSQLPKAWLPVLADALVLEGAQLAHGTKEEHEQGVATLQEATAVLSRLPLKDSHPKVTGARCALARALGTVGKHKKAVQLLEKVLASCKQAYGSESGACAAALQGLGAAWHGASNYENAIQYYRLALKIRRKLFGATSRQALLSVDSLAVSLHSCSKHEEAVELFQQCLATATQQCPGPSEAAAALHYKLGSAYSRNGDAKNAVAQLRLCLAMREELHGPTHRLVAVSLIKLASLLADAGDYPAAAENYRRALDVQRRVYGGSHLKVAAILDRLGEVCWDWQKVDDCRRFSELALEMRQALLPADHPVVAVSMYKLALICDESGEMERARLLYDKSMEVWKKNYGDKHPILELGMAGLKKLNRGRRYRSLTVRTGL